MGLAAALVDAADKMKSPLAPKTTKTKQQRPTVEGQIKMKPGSAGLAAVDEEGSESMKTAVDGLRGKVFLKLFCFCKIFKLFQTHQLGDFLNGAERTLQAKLIEIRAEAVGLVILKVRLTP
jgi:hypothetical protein